MTTEVGDALEVLRPGKPVYRGEGGGRCAGDLCSRCGEGWTSWGDAMCYQCAFNIVLKALQAT